MIVVSGCPRSGTSLMMDLMRVALGDDRIVGEKFPKERDGDPAKRALREHVMDRRNPKWREHREHSRKMNPNGFYECAWSVRGIQYTDDPPADNSVVKIVSQGLARSNPDYIGKVVYMVRHPWSVAKSHLDLVVNGPVRTTNRELGDQSPTMYCRVTAAAAAWIDKHNPYLLLVDFDELVTNPGPVLARVAEFIGEGDWQAAQSQIEPKLRRNQPERTSDHAIWDLSLELHAMLKECNWQGIGKRFDEYAKAQSKRARLYCTRWGGEVNEIMCNNCQSDHDYRLNLIKTATRRGIEWDKEPCVWECGGKPGDGYTPLTIEQSVANNHWIESAKSRGLGDTIEKITRSLGIKPCGRCRRWKKKLNKLFPYKD